MKIHEEHISYKVGSLLVIWITGCIPNYIAEVTQEEPLRLKVQEEGQYAHLKDGDFIIRGVQSVQIQKDDNDPEAHNEQQAMLANAAARKRPFLSGLKKLGVTDGKIREILPLPV